MRNAPLPVRTQVAFIRAMLRNYYRVSSLPRGARLIFMAGTYFTESRAVVVREMMFAAGCWETARGFMRSKLPDDVFKRLSAWAAKVKGGAS